MTGGVGTGVALGLLTGLGLAMISNWVVSRRASLAQRVAPHIRSGSDDEVRAQTATVTPFPTIERLIAPVLRDVSKALERWGSPTEVLRERLTRSGSHLSVEQFRNQQVLWAIAALVVGLVLAGLLAATRGSSPVALAILVLLIAVLGAMGRDLHLVREIRKREERMISELPTVAELLALAVSAGEGALGALERVSRTTHGAVADELRATLATVRTGTPLPTALHQLGSRTGLPALRRFADGIAIAIERGTPLAEVLRAQAADVRAEGRRALMEEGGKREIAMLVPVVFLILPVAVVFAVFPGLAAIQIGM